MTYQQRVKFKIIVISIALLVGQFVALVHSVKHPFHQPIESCRIYFALEQSGNGLIYEGIATISPILQPYVWIGFSCLLISRSFTSYRIRAPPSLS